MESPPSGTVTFLFTDVEGSTRLLRNVGPERYDRALGEHQKLLRAVFAEHDGVEVDTQGDSFFVAFARAVDAVSAAQEFTEALADGPIRVRVGIHTGEPLLGEAGYVGMDVHRAARIADAGHGGQVLLSQTTRDLVPELQLRDLGEHRLKDLARPERLYQLGSRAFPPLKSLNRSNLPVPAGPLVGRGRELAEIARRITGGQRLVTIVGPGGAGKTRLAIQAAAEVADFFPDGVTFVPLAEVHDPAVALHVAAEAAGVPLVSDLASRRELLVLDNFEHLTAAAPRLSALLQTSDAIQVLATSRAPLRISGEHEYRLEALERPAAMRLLRVRACAIGRTVDDDEVAAELCARLDDLPLAIELAAARLRGLRSDALLGRLSRRLPLLTHGPRDAPARQRTLEQTIRWSYDLLGPEPQAALTRLSIFPGSFTLAAAEAITSTGIDLVDELIEASLVKAVNDGERLLLLETIREFASDRLEGVERESLTVAHACHYLDFLADVPRAFATDGLEILPVIASEFHNIRQSIDTANASGDSGRILAGCEALSAFWNFRGSSDTRLSEAISNALNRAPSKEHQLPGLLALGILYRLQGDNIGLNRVNARRLALARKSGNPHLIGSALNNQAMAAWDQGEIEEAKRLFAEAGPLREYRNQPNLAMLHFSVGELDEAEAVMRRSVSEAEELGVATEVAFDQIWLAWGSLRTRRQPRSSAASLNRPRSGGNPRRRRTNGCPPPCVLHRRRRR